MSVQRLGIGELKVVKERIVKYERGEIAHIENVMKTEERERKHRRLDRVEETTVLEEETTTVTERDLQSTERFEMRREAEKTVEQDQKLDAGLKVSGSYGTVNFVATANFATSSATQETASEAARYARDLVQRSASKVTERTREVRTLKKLIELEETNRHGFENKGPGSADVSGIYQWVDKIYSAQVMNYGYRLMYEFIVPEPAALYLHVWNNRDVEGVTLDEPTPLGNLKPSDLDAGTYELWVSRYNVQDVSPPPPKVRLIGTSLELKGSGKPVDSTNLNKELKVPPGYKATFAWAIGSRTEWKKYDGDAVYPHLAVVVGRFRLITSSANPIGWGKIEDFMGAPDNIVPVSVHGSGVESYVFNIEVRCERLPAHLEEWRLKTYAAIVDAYEKKKAAYDAQVRSAKLDAELELPKRSAAANRAIEKAELKRACISIFAKQDFSSFDAMVPPTGGGYPEIDLKEAAAEGPEIQFLEQAFEWGQMTYLFYPYFWGRKKNWLEVLQEDDSDPVFKEFLRAGSARVVVPVRRGYEAAIAYFEQTGKPFFGGTPPIINDPLFVSVLTEIKAKTRKYEEAIPEGEPWEYRLPTTLVILPGAKLPDYATSASGSGGG